MGKMEILGNVGSMQQLAFVRPVVFTEGRAANLPAYAVKNGPISFTVMAGKGLDIADFSYKGINVNFFSKPGLMGRNHFDTNGGEALRSIMGGLFFTCGLENICAPCQVNGKEYPMHGRMRTTPAEHVSCDASWIGDKYHLRIRGEMREAELFGENLVLRRSIETILGDKSTIIRDEIENESFREEPMMLLYHFNIGYPLLSEKCRVILPTKDVRPREAASAPHVARWAEFEAPKANEHEYVFIHELAADKGGNTFAAVFNDELKIGLKLEFNKNDLPYFMQWKSVGAGDYVLGLEPSNSSVYGKLFHLENKNLHMLGSFSKEVIEIKLTVLDGEPDLIETRRRREELIQA
jgi:hypothetical protein